LKFRFFGGVFFQRFALELFFLLRFFGLLPTLLFDFLPVRRSLG